MAIKIPIVTEFNGTGMKKAVQAFKQLDGAAAKAKFAMKALAVTGAAAIAALGVSAFQAGQKLAEFARMSSLGASVAVGDGTTFRSAER